MSDSVHVFCRLTGPTLHFSAQCMTHISADDKVDIERALIKARALEEQSLVRRDGEAASAVVQKNFTFNVAFTVVYLNETAAGGYVKCVFFFGLSADSMTYML